MSIKRAGGLGFWVASILAIKSATAGPPAVVFEVEAGAFARRDTPVLVPLPDDLKNASGFALENLDDHKGVPVQRMAYHVKGYDGVAWIIREPLAAGSTRRYRLSADGRNAVSRPGGGVHAFVDGQPLGHESGKLDNHKTGTLRVGDRPVLTYQAAVAEPPAPIDPVYRRSGFIHPLQTPSGLAVTDDFPPDHPHQHGLFLAWVNTTFEGRHIDFWNQKERTGRVSHAPNGKVDPNSIRGGPVFGELLVELLHEDLTAPDGPKPVLRETWLVLVFDIPGHFVVDFTSAQHAIDAKLTVNKYHYGGLGLRGNRQWFDPAVQGVAAPDPAGSSRSDFLTSEGKHRGDGNHTRPRWVDLSGEVDGKFAGVAILDSPSNFRFPQPVRLHPNKPYFCFAPMVDDEFAIAHGHPYVSRYRLLVHDGPPDPEAIERAWRDYAEPPRVRIVEDKPS
jgi:hypothetical protein